MLSIQLAIRFFIELAVLIFIGYWGFTMDGHWLMKGAVGIGGPLLLAVLWGLFVAPKAMFSISVLGKIGIEAFIFLLGIWAVYSRFGQMPAVVLAIMMLLNSSYVHLKTNSSQKIHL